MLLLLLWMVKHLLNLLNDFNIGHLEEVPLFEEHTAVCELMHA